MRNLPWVLLFFLPMGGVHAIELHCTASPMAAFVYELITNSREEGANVALLRDLEELDFELDPKLEKQAYHASEAMDTLLFPPSMDVGDSKINNFLYHLATLPSIDQLDVVLRRVEGDKIQQKRLRDTLTKAYKVYVQSNWPQNHLIQQLEAINALLMQHNNDLNTFWKQFLSFYGIEQLAYEQFSIYICPDKDRRQSFSIGNAIFLPVEATYKGHENEILTRYPLASILGELLFVIRQNQPIKLQHSIDYFFLHYPSQYAYVAYKYFHEALATALVSRFLTEQVAGFSDISSTDSYIQGFAKAIYPVVNTYLAQGRTMDDFFLKQVLACFTQAFPKVTTDLSQILERLILVSQEFNTGQAREQLHNFGFAHSVFFCPLDATTYPPNSDTPYYDTNAPIVFVLSSPEKEGIRSLRTGNPFLKKVKKSKLKKLKNGFDYYRDKQGRLYLFFTVANYTELEKQLAALKQRQYLN